MNSIARLRGEKNLFQTRRDHSNEETIQLGASQNHSVELLSDDSGKLYLCRSRKRHSYSKTLFERWGHRDFLDCLLFLSED